jgi:Amidohydrolase family
MFPDCDEDRFTFSPKANFIWPSQFLNLRSSALAPYRNLINCVCPPITFAEPCKIWEVVTPPLNGQTRGRNLAFNAGTAAAYGLTKEEALQAITLNTAKILGVADKTGTIEVGKDANIVICEGDILDMRSSVITDAFIQGRKIDLNDKHKQLYERYNQTYNLKKPF